MNPKLTTFFSPPMGPSEKYETKFLVRLCGDVFLEILRSGNRRRLAKLERVGRRFNRMIENFLGKTPFLRIGLEIALRFLFFGFSQNE